MIDWLSENCHAFARGSPGVLFKERTLGAFVCFKDNTFSKFVLYLLTELNIVACFYVRIFSILVIINQMNIYLSFAYYKDPACGILASLIYRPSYSFCCNA